MGEVGGQYSREWGAGEGWVGGQYSREGGDRGRDRDGRAQEERD